MSHWLSGEPLDTGMVFKIMVNREREGGEERRGREGRRGERKREEDRERRERARERR
jgi:hypothetical protein